MMKRGYVLFVIVFLKRCSVARTFRPDFKSLFKVLQACYIFY